MKIIPYNKIWFIKINGQNPTRELKTMLSREFATNILQSSQINFFPAKLFFTEELPFNIEGNSRNYRVQVHWEDMSYELRGKLILRSTPKLLETSIQQIYLENNQLSISHSMIIAPYLSEKKIHLLAERGVSGIDLCGNGIIMIPNKLLLYKVGNPNKFPDSTSIQNPFRGKSSLVSRVFLICSRFYKISDILEKINNLGGTISLATISKVVKILDEQLLVRKDGREVYLLQREELLEHLSKRFKRTHEQRLIRGKTSIEKVSELALKLSQLEGHEKYAMFWIDGVNPYSAMARSESISLFANSDKIIELLEVDTSSRFPNIEIRLTQDPIVYFDRRTWHKEFLFASPIQIYLELMQGDKRDKETAQQVKNHILQNF